MDANVVQLLKTGSEEEVCRALRDFNEKNVKTFSFPDISSEIKEECIGALINRLKGHASSLCYVQCLETLRIFSRDKQHMEALTSDEALKLMLKHAWLQQYAEECDEPVTLKESDMDVMIEAQKCLCNLIYNSPKAQKVCSQNGCVEGIIQRLKTYKDPDLKFEVKFFDMRMLFLLTALCADTRPKIHSELHGFSYLMEVIDLTLRDAEELRTGLTDQEVDLCCEILKILFNLTVSINKKSLDEEEDGHFMRLVSVLHDLLICKTESRDKRDDLQSHTVNLLTNMPNDCFDQLLTPLNESGAESIDSKDIEYDGKNMDAIASLLNFLYRRLDRVSKSLKENLTPILHCLCETCRTNRAIRKFCRSKVLPPLRDEVKNLPEEGDSLRNRLCKLLTSPVTEVKDLAADFLFVLCKESVTRMVKYTGYGNCAELLANRGLLLGGRGRGDYSSESEDSETEEYAQLKEQVNPVTGRWEEEKARPMEGMSDEQKEEEAMKLISRMNELQKQGIIQPGCVSEDGRPVPVSHILELADKLHVSNQSGMDSDSD